VTARENAWNGREQLAAVNCADALSEPGGKKSWAHTWARTLTRMRSQNRQKQLFALAKPARTSGEVDGKTDHCIEE
jgi:hypothetical protein